jgi:hypothetical protein
LFDLNEVRRQLKILAVQREETSKEKRNLISMQGDTNALTIAAAAKIIRSRPAVK